ncbi:hypothetical protein [Pseudomonas sp. Larv2_ips]|nr:hypothetical protein [Pseudomonas sp. Larv2_ips]
MISILFLESRHRGVEQAIAAGVPAFYETQINPYLIVLYKYLSIMEFKR